MTGERIEHVLADFRGWLEALAALPAASPPAEPLNVQALVAQLTALRHDVNMQTKAARTAVEQTTAALKLLQPAEDEPADEEEPDAEHLRPVVKMLLDVHDALSVARRQTEKAGRSAEPIDPPAATPPGFFARLFGATPQAAAWQRYAEQVREQARKSQQQFAAVADGYTMSLRRIERTFDELGLEAISCVDQPFDPELMEVLDTAAGTGRPAGTVVDVLRQGYLWNDALFRYAQVKVAK